MIATITGHGVMRNPVSTCERPSVPISRNGSEMNASHWVANAQIAVITELEQRAAVEIERLDEIAGTAGVVQDVLVRVTVGVEAHTHEFISTAHEDQKFGLSLASGAAMAAVRRYAPPPYAGRVCMYLPNKAWVRSGTNPLRWHGQAPQA